VALANKYLKDLKLFDFCKSDIMLGMQILKHLEEGARKKVHFHISVILIKIDGYGTYPWTFLFPLRL
jgi:hypothetical protein